MNCMEPIQPCLPPNSAWTRGLLHDLASENNKMDEYFSTLFYDNPADVFGIDFALNNKCDERRKDMETDRINFHNKQNKLVSEGRERLYERNADMDKLIAKFDANIEDIWKTTSESDQLKNRKYQTLFSQNFFGNPCLQYGSNLIWSFDQNEKGGRDDDYRIGEKEEIPNFKSSFSHWNKFSSPALTSANNGLDTMLGAFNVTLSNLKKWSAMDGQNNSPNGLPNHNKNGSCFMEVLPKTAEIVAEQKESSGYATLTQQNSQEEEDLLTSAKTHFRPIRTEELASSQTGIYADGTTFAISNDLEKVSFKRSESGALYLEADANTPRKYMEYKEKEGGHKLDSESDISSMEEFVPKFRVRQSNEKCCQTDEFEEEQMVPSVQDSDGESESYDSEEDEFYFPGDDELAQNIINAVDDETEIEKENLTSDCNYNDISDVHDHTMELMEMSSYKIPESGNCMCGSGKEWKLTGSIEPIKRQEWREIWNPQTTCESCKKNSEKLSSKDKFRFREELTQEGEQLLLDLSCIQQMYSSSDWGEDDSKTSSDVNEEDNQNLTEEVTFEGFVSSEVFGNFGKNNFWSALIAKDEPVKSSFDVSRLWKEENVSSNLLESEKNKMNEINERPFITDIIQIERKRRNSSSQKACNLYMEGQCRRPHCRFAHCDSAIPCPFFADSSCMKGESCPLSHSGRRPLSL